MAQSRSSALWVVVGIIVAGLLIAGLVYGPSLYREGKAAVGPVVELTRAEEAIAALVATLRARYGDSRALRELETHLRQRLAALENPVAPPVDGVPGEDQALLWEHRQEIADLDLNAFQAVHVRLLEGEDGVRLEIGSDR